MYVYKPVGAIKDQYKHNIYTHTYTCCALKKKL